MIFHEYCVAYPLAERSVTTDADANYRRVVPKALKKENGAAFRWPSRSKGTIQAIGRARVVDRRTLCRSLSNRVIQSKRVSQFINRLGNCGALRQLRALLVTKSRFGSSFL